MNNNLVTKKQFMIACVAITMIIVLTQIGLFLLMNEQFQERILMVEEKVDVQNEITLLKINETATELLYQLEREKINTEEQRLLLEKSTLENIEELQESLKTTTTALQTSIEEQLESVDNKVASLEQKSDDLESSISKIKVTSSDFTEIVDDVIDAVVSIKTERGQGSGVIVHKNGYVVTNKHVVENVLAVIIIDSESRVYGGKVIAYAGNADLAIIKITSDEIFPYLKFEEDVSVGERVIAVGNPYGLSFSVTEGIISALNRNMDSTDVGYIQTDVSINEGNSGGPLVNTGKRIVGINTKKISEGEGLGFAIPASVAKDIAEQAINDYEAIS
jgi:S1-C subfamily serine protease